MNNVRIVSVVAVVWLASGCDDPKPTADPAASAKASSAAVAPSASAKEDGHGHGEGRGEGKGEGKGEGRAEEKSPDEGSGEGKHGDDVCPTGVAGAKSTVEDTDKGVVLKVVADAADAQKQIAERAEALLKRQADAGKEKAAHSGTGGGGGLGRCPVVIRGTKITLEAIPAAAGSPGGTRIQVDSLKPQEVDALRRETKQRLAALDKP